MPSIIGHRGCAAHAPENTLASVRMAWEQGADAVEIDVFLTRDGQLVAHHDETTRKTAGIDRPVADQTLAELRTLDVGRWKGERFAGERIPTLAEVIDTIPSGKRLYVEIKCGPECVPEFRRVVRASRHPLDDVAAISFHRSVLQAMKDGFPELAAYWVIELRRDDAGAWLPSVDEIVRVAQEVGVNGVDLGCAPPLDRPFVDRLHAAGLPVLIWTVNDVETALSLSAAGVDGLTTDRPGDLRRELTERGGVLSQ